MSDFVKVGVGLRSPIWQENAPEEIMNKALERAAGILETRLHDNLLTSVRSGRFYRISDGSPRQKQPKQIREHGKRKPYVRKKLKNESSSVTKPHSNNYNPGAIVIQASAAGESPQIRTRRLFNAIRVIVVPKKGISVRVNAPMAGALDDPSRFNRPFIRKIAKQFEKEDLVPIVKEAIKEMISGKY